MIAQHTLTHAIQYLIDADLSCAGDEGVALAVMDPGKPCAAYVLARRTLKRCGSLDAAIVDLQLQPRETSHEN